MLDEHRKSIAKQLEKWTASEPVSATLQNSLLSELLNNLILESKRPENSKIAGPDFVKTFLDNPNNGTLRELKNNYTHACLYWKKAKDEDDRFLRVNIKFNIQAVFFRILTTLAIGFSIMLVYWTAHCLGVPMPLLRIPT